MRCQTKHDDVQALVQFLRFQPWANSWAKELHSPNHRGSKGPCKIPVLAKLMKHAVIRHTKKQIFDGEQILKLPDRTQCVRMLELNADEKKLYTEMEKTAAAGFDATTDYRRDTLKLMSMLLPLRMLCSDPSAVQEKHVTASAAASGDNMLSEAGLRAKLKLSNVNAQQANAAVMSMRTLDTECPVCMGVMEEPACASTCAHVFCTECITGVITAKPGDTGPCPLCRAPVTIADLMQLEPELDTSGAAAKSESERMLDLIKAKTGTKMRALLGSLREMEQSDPGAKAVVFTQFQNTHAALVATLKTAGIGTVQIRGNMTQKARSNALNNFLTDPNITVFALSLRSGAVGLTLTAASRCFLLEPCINEGTEQQAFNRIHRMGQVRQSRRLLSHTSRALGLAESLCSHCAVLGCSSRRRKSAS